MKRTHSRLIIGTAISAAAIAVAIDHSRQRLPEAEKQLASSAVIIIDEGDELPADASNDCNKPSIAGRQASPCSL
ncbi:MAG: hypothetical protein WBN96_11735 [Gammaproteobacteria bacterium]